MDYMVVISAVALGLSVLATIAKFLDWFMHSDPRTMVRTTRWMLLLAVLACIPLLVVMLAKEQWAGAMLVGAAVLIIPTILKWRVMFAPLRAAFAYFRPRPRPFDMEIWEDEATGDPATVQRAAAILEAYVGRSSLVALSDERPAGGDAAAGLSRTEALEVLGLDPGADEAAIRAAHKRLLSLVHPDHSGSPYLTKKVNEARDALLGPAREWPPAQEGAGRRKSRLAKR